jgi:hypothetical protein
LKIFDLFGMTLAASAGLCGAVLAFGPAAAAAPLPRGGPACEISDLAGPAAAAPAPVVLPGPLGVPGAPVPAGFPGGAPVPAGFPGGAPVPAGFPGGAPVPAGFPGGAPLAAGAPADAAVPVAAPIVPQAGTGKGVPTDPGPALTADPVVLPGPPPVSTPVPPVPVLAAATGPALPCCNP